MKLPRKSVLPLRLLVLDLIGSVLFTLGLIPIVLGFHTLPTSLRFEHYPWVFIAVGVALWLPALVHIAMKIQARLEDVGRGP